jgi:hypothetical protein
VAPQPFSWSRTRLASDTTFAEKGPGRGVLSRCVSPGVCRSAPCRANCGAARPHVTRKLEAGPERLRTSCPRRHHRCEIPAPVDSESGLRSGGIAGRHHHPPCRVNQLLTLRLAITQVAVDDGELGLAAGLIVDADEKRLMMRCRTEGKSGAAKGFTILAACSTPAPSLTDVEQLLLASR